MEHLSEKFLNSKIKDIYQKSYDIQNLINEMYSLTDDFRLKIHTGCLDRDKFYFDLKVRILSVHNELLNFVEECHRLQSFYKINMDKIKVELSDKCKKD